MKQKELGTVEEGKEIEVVVFFFVPFCLQTLLQYQVNLPARCWNYVISVNFQFTLLAIQQTKADSVINWN
jgi:hypothetical protein